MRITVYALAALLALPVAAAGTTLDLPSLPLPAALGSRAVEITTRGMLLDPAWLLTDPSFQQASDVVVVAHRFGPRFVVRGTPSVRGIPVEGADRIIVIDGVTVRHVQGTERSLVPVSEFRVAAHEAMATAFLSVKGGLIIDPTVENISGFAHPVWVAAADGLHAAFRFRVPTWRESR